MTQQHDPPYDSPVLEQQHDMSQQQQHHYYDQDGEEWSWEAEQIMYQQQQLQQNGGAVQVLSSPRSRTSSADEIIPFYDPNVVYTNQQQQQLQQHHVAWLNHQTSSPLPTSPAVDYNNYGTPNSGSSHPITWSEPGHPLLSPSRDETTTSSSNYGATSTARTPPPPSSSGSRRSSRRKSGKKSSSGGGRPPSPHSSVFKTPARGTDEQHQLTQIYSSGHTTTSPYNNKSSPPPPPPSRSALFSREHRRVHSANADNSQTIPLLQRHVEEEEEDDMDNAVTARSAPRSQSLIARPSHKRSGSFGRSSSSHHHRRTNSLGGGRPSGHHRRTHSFGSSDHNRHRRTYSSDGLPPVSPGYTLERKKSGGLRPPRATRARSFSSGDGGRNNNFSPAPLMRSGSELSFTSIASGVSVGSVVSDVRRSKLFRGVTETGKVLFHAPTDKVHLLMDSDLESGIVYKSAMPDDYDEFSEYLLEEDINYLEGCACNCNCDNCAECHKKHQALSEAKYILTVDDDLYKRVLSELSDSRTMPCRLFYCGHHEDVDHPSIFIAVGIVLLVFAFMAYVSWIYEP